MPLLYSISGRSTPYREIQVQPVTPVSPAFESIISQKMAGAEKPTEKPLDRDAQKRRQLRDVLKNAYVKPDMPMERKPAVLARQIMSTHVQCVHPEVNIEEAEKLMKQRVISHLPVTTDEGKLIGILSDREVLLAHDKPEFFVSNYMITEVLTATPDTPIREIAGALLHSHIHCLPIVDMENRVIGILTTTDIIRAIAENAPVDLWV